MLKIIISFLKMVLGIVLASVVTVVSMFLCASMYVSSNIKLVTTLQAVGMMCLTLGIYYYFLYKKHKIDRNFIYFHTVYGLIVTITFAFIFTLGNASLLNPYLNLCIGLAAPFLLLYIIIELFAGSYCFMIVVGVCLCFTQLLLSYLLKERKCFKIGIAFIALGVICATVYFQSPHYKYRHQSHDFDYMNGYSSVDLSPYQPFENGVIVLDHEASLQIENENEMPKMDGAEACYPVYSSIAKAIYKDIDQIEKEYQTLYPYENGKIVTFYNTAIGFERLVNGEIDLFFGAKPSKSQLEYARSQNVELEYIPIGKEAFVFFVNEDNPIDSLTSDEIRQIYSGHITNWKEVGGMNEKIIAYQRPERSGSQSMMVYFMQDTPLKEPLSYEMEYSMRGIIRNVAQYTNDSGAIGYSFRYFLEGLNQEQDVKMIALDKKYPNKENIQNGNYPMIATLYCIKVKDNDSKNVDQVIDFLLSEDGQTIIEKSGYVRLEN